MEVFAFEGNLPEEKVVSWGAGAVRNGERVWNPALRRECTQGDADRLVAEGHLTLLPAPIQIDEQHAGRPLVVAVIRLDARHATFLTVDTGRVGGLAGHGRAQGFATYVFADQAAFDRYAIGAIDDLLHRVLFGEHDEHRTSEELIRLGLTLHSGHPFLLATWVHLSGHEPFVEELARANLRSDDNSRDFDEILTSFRLLDGNYELIYEGGVAEGGGIDLNVAAKTFTNLHYIHQQVAPTLGRDFPCLQAAFAPPRFQEMKAASAHITFSAGPVARPLGERLARVVELRAIQAALEGRAPEEVKTNPKFEKAVKAVLVPSADTAVSHRPMDEEVAVPVEPDDGAPVLPTRSEQLVLLGFQEDLKDRATRAGIRLGPNAHIWVSATDNGAGERPEGIEFLQQGNDFLFRPAVFVVERRIQGHREAYFLLRMAFLATSESAVLTALPSAVVEGAYLVDVEVEVRRSAEDTLIVQGAPSVQGLSGRTLGMAAAWLRTFAKGCRDREVAAAVDEGARWIQPPRAPRPSALARLLVALDVLGGEARVADIVHKINELFDTTVRTNNTRREVLHYPDLLEFVGEDRRTVRITDIGAAYLSAYLRAGGSTGVALDD